MTDAPHQTTPARAPRRRGRPRKDFSAVQVALDERLAAALEAKRDELAVEMQKRETIYQEACRHCRVSPAEVARRMRLHKKGHADWTREDLFRRLQRVMELLTRERNQRIDDTFLSRQEAATIRATVLEQHGVSDAAFRSWECRARRGVEDAVTRRQRRPMREDDPDDQEFDDFELDDEFDVDYVTPDLRAYISQAGMTVRDLADQIYAAAFAVREDDVEVDYDETGDSDDAA